MTAPEKRKHLAHVVMETCKVVMVKSLPLTRFFFAQPVLPDGRYSLLNSPSSMWYYSFSSRNGTIAKDLNKKWITTQWKKKCDNPFKPRLDFHRLFLLPLWISPVLSLKKKKGRFVSFLYLTQSGPALSMYEISIKKENLLALYRQFSSPPCPGSAAKEENRHLWVAPQENVRLGTGV